jgi:Golgi phosphoprotein 3 (GPP34)
MTPSRPDGLTIADELVVLHTYPRGERDTTMANVGMSAAVGALAELVVAGQVAISELDPEQLGWLKRRRVRRDGAHPLRLKVVDPAPRGEQSLDSVLKRLEGMQDKDLPWCILHLNDVWEQVNQGLFDRGVKLRTDKHGQGGGVDGTVEAHMQQRLQNALSDPEMADVHTGAVLLIARAGELFQTGSRERELIGPIDEATLRGQLTWLAGRPTLAVVERLARAGAKALDDERVRKAEAADAVAWHE